MPTTTKSTPATKAQDVERTWHLIDLDGKVLGRAMGEIVDLLLGKSKRTFAPYLDGGDYVVVINSRTVKTTGKKGAQKIYDRYSGYQSGRKTLTLNEVMSKQPNHVVHEAVSGMLPKNKHRDARLARLYIFEGAEHPYAHKFSQK